MLFSVDIDFSGSGTPQVSIAYEGNSITFSPLSDISLDDPITANDHVARIGQVDNCLTLENITPTGSNTVTYANVFTATDLTYVLDNHGVKEYIILNSTDAPNEFSFMFQLDGLKMQTIENETFFMDAEGMPVFLLGQLFAVDGADERTRELTYSFTPVKGTTHVIVTVTLSEDYLSDPARVFPVVIDPTIMISSAQTDDTCVLSYYPDYNYYNSNYLRTGYDSDYGIRRSFIQFDIPTSIPEGSVTYAELDLEKCGGVAPTMRAYRCSIPWTSSAKTWENQPIYTSYAYSGWAVPYREGSAWYKLDVTEIVQSWVDNLYLNCGFALIDTTENDPNHWTTYYSSDMESPHKPELHITYTDPNDDGGDEGGSGTNPTDPIAPTDPPIVTPTLSLSKSSTDVDVDKTVHLTATTYPSATISWTSTNPSVATVDSSGKVTGKSLGTTTIRASANGLTANCTVYVTLADGVYFIRNRETGKCVDIDGDTASNGTPIHQWAYHGGTTQKWYIAHLSLGIYTIKSQSSSTTACYLRVSEDSSANDQPIVLQTGALTTGMMWKIEETTNGAYKVIPRTGETNDRVLAVGTGLLGATSNGTAIQQRDYDDAGYKGEWYIYSYNPYTLNVYYDSAYQDRYGSTSNAVARITDQLEELRQKFLDYDIAVSWNGPYLRSTSSCVTTKDGVCTHASDDDCGNSTYTGTESVYHHTNITNIMGYMQRNYSTESQTSAIAIYIGHDACAVTTDGHKEKPYGGLAWPEANIVALNSWADDSASTNTDAFVLIHEFGHLFGVLDHNDELETNRLNEYRTSNFYDGKCIYGEKRSDSDVISNQTICDGCRETIRQYTANYYEDLYGDS